VAATAGLLAGGLAAAAPAVAGTAAPAAPAAAKALKWGKCAESDLRQAGAACAMLTLPLNYSDPTGPTIKIAVSRIKHTSSAANYQGVILTNPGGPGGSGLDLNTFLIAQLKAEGSAADKAAAADYDWIGFDPRGVGSSVPAITCAPYYFSGDRENYNPGPSRS
jgi:pimeloyl-ACP methyl ester carboxylesterase